MSGIGTIFASKISVPLRNAIKSISGTAPAQTKYFYHITSRKNYLKMGVCDEVKTSLDGCFGGKNNLRGIFMFDLENFVANWRTSNSWKGNLGLTLLQHASKGSKDLVCIRIPLTLEQQKSLLARSQNELFRYRNFKQGSQHHAMYADNISDINPQMFQTDAMEFIYPKSVSWQEIEYVGSANVDNVRAKLPKNASAGQWVETTLKEFFSKQKS